MPIQTLDIVQSPVHDVVEHVCHRPNSFSNNEETIVSKPVDAATLEAATIGLSLLVNNADSAIPAAKQTQSTTITKQAIHSPKALLTYELNYHNALSKDIIKPCARNPKPAPKKPKICAYIAAETSLLNYIQATELARARGSIDSNPHSSSYNLATFKTLIQAYNDSVRSVSYTNKGYHRGYKGSSKRAAKLLQLVEITESNNLSLLTLADLVKLEFKLIF